MQILPEVNAAWTVGETKQGFLLLASGEDGEAWATHTRAAATAGGGSHHEHLFVAGWVQGAHLGGDLFQQSGG